MSQSNGTPHLAENAVAAVDLSQLAVQRGAKVSPKLKTRRRWVTRYFIPGVICTGFVSMFAWAARETFLPAQTVTVTPVIVTKAEVQEAGTPLFQAAGWIEPSPTAVTVSSLAPGVVEKVFVVEGQRVELGDPVAKLIDADAKLALQQAEAQLRLCDAEVQNAEASVLAAQTSLANPNELQAALADAESTLADVNLTLGNLPFLIDAAKTRRQLAVDNVSRKQQAGNAVAGRLLREATAELAAAESALAELQSRQPTLESQAESLERKRRALSQQLTLMSEQKRAVAAAEASLAAARARQDQAQISVESAKLNLERMTIRAPIAGRVLTVDARPGTRLAGMDPLSQQSSSAVVSLYEPDRLQVRVDVRLEDVPQVQIGQPATIETAALKTPVAGRVSWVTTRADIQKNTLQVKVVIDNPPEVITPEMLGQVTFLAPAQAGEAAIAEKDPLKLLIPRALVQGAEGSAAVWVVDPARNVARLQAVTLGRAGTDELVEVVAGVDPTAKLIVGGRESLVEGTRIKIAGEDESAGPLPRRTGGGPQAVNMAQAAGVTK